MSFPRVQFFWVNCGSCWQWNMVLGLTYMYWVSLGPRFTSWSLQWTSLTWKRMVFNFLSQTLITYELIFHSCSFRVRLIEISRLLMSFLVAMFIRMYLIFCLKLLSFMNSFSILVHSEWDWLGKIEIVDVLSHRNVYCKQIFDTKLFTSSFNRFSEQGKCLSCRVASLSTRKSTWNSRATSGASTLSSPMAGQGNRSTCRTESTSTNSGNSFGPKFHESHSTVACKAFTMPNFTPSGSKSLKVRITFVSVCEPRFPTESCDLLSSNLLFFFLHIGEDHFMWIRQEKTHGSSLSQWFFLNYKVEQLLSSE